MLPLWLSTVCAKPDVVIAIGVSVLCETVDGLAVTVHAKAGKAERKKKLKKKNTAFFIAKI